MRKPAILVTAMIVLALNSGCVYTSYVSKDGGKLTRISVFGDQRIGKVDLSRGLVEGYASEQSQIAASVVEAAITAARKNQAAGLPERQ
jgi:hypothetical protein